MCDSVYDDRLLAGICSIYRRHFSFCATTAMHMGEQEEIDSLLLPRLGLRTVKVWAVWDFGFLPLSTYTAVCSTGCAGGNRWEAGF